MEYLCQEGESNMDYATEITALKEQLKTVFNTLDNHSKEQKESNSSITDLKIEMQELKLTLQQSIEVQKKTNEFMEKQQNKGNLWLEKFIWILLGAVPSWIASYFFKK